MENKNPEHEKRGSTRIHKNLIVQYSITPVSSMDRKWDLSLVQDISEKGISFTVKECIAAGSTVDMILKIPLRPFDWFEFTGKLVACDEFQPTKEGSTGERFLARIAFLELKEEQKKLIHEYISWCLAKYGGAK